MAILTAKDVVDGLVARGYPEHIAQGVAMNFRDESGFNTGINEQHPIAGRGGYGLAQWTGPRRVALEDFAKARGVSPDDPNAQLDFFAQENATTEAGPWKQVLASQNANDAAANFVKYWERPASGHMADRMAKYAGMSWDDKGWHQDPSVRQDPISGYVAPATPVQPAAPPKTPTEALAAGIKGYGDAGKAPQLPGVAPAQFTASGGQMMPMVGDSLAEQNRRQMLAQMMAQYGIT